MKVSSESGGGRTQESTGKLQLLVSFENSTGTTAQTLRGTPLCRGGGGGAMDNGGAVSSAVAHGQSLSENEWSTVPSCGVRLSDIFCSGEQTSLVLFPSAWGRLPSRLEILWHPLRVFDALKAAQFWRTQAHPLLV